MALATDKTIRDLMIRLKAAGVSPDSARLISGAVDEENEAQQLIQWLDANPNPSLNEITQMTKTILTASNR